MDMSDPRDLVQAILSPSGPPQVFTLNLSQFREVFEEIQQTAQGTPIDVVLNGDWAMVQFSRLCNHRIRVLQDLPSNPILRLFVRLFCRRKVLTEKDFEFASLYAEFYGARTYLSFRSFLAEELSTNWLPLFLTLLVSWIAFQSLASSGTTSGKEALEKVNELLLTAATLYLSIFILFTVSQNVGLIEDPYLFRKGLTHRFFRVDKSVAALAIAVVCVSILDIVLLNAPHSVSLSFFGRSLTIQNVSVAAPILSAVGVTTLADCFLALVQYYFRRVRYVLERKLTKGLLDELWDKRNTQQRD